MMVTLSIGSFAARITAIISSSRSPSIPCDAGDAVRQPVVGQYDGSRGARASTLPEGSGGPETKPSSAGSNAVRTSCPSSTRRAMRAATWASAPSLRHGELDRKLRLARLASPVALPAQPLARTLARPRPHSDALTGREHAQRRGGRPVAVRPQEQPRRVGQRLRRARTPVRARPTSSRPAPPPSSRRPDRGSARTASRPPATSPRSRSPSPLSRQPRARMSPDGSFEIPRIIRPKRARAHRCDPRLLARRSTRDEARTASTPSSAMQKGSTTGLAMLSPRITH